MTQGGATLGAMFGAGQVAGFMGLPQVALAEVAGAQVVVLGAAGCTPYPSVGHYCAGGPRPFGRVGRPMPPIWPI